MSVENVTPKEEHSTPESPMQSEAAHLLRENAKELKAIVTPMARAIREHLQGKPVDFSSARAEVIRHLDDDILSLVSPLSRSRIQSFVPSDLSAAYLDRINSRRASATTGITELNRVLTGGFEQDRLVVLLGAPGSGKTTLANQMAVHMAANKRAVLYVTSEDSPHTLYAKTIARLGKMDYGMVLRGRPYGDVSQEQITATQQTIQEKMHAYDRSTGAAYIRYVDATQGITLDEIYNQAQAHFRALEETASGAPILIVDYLQRLSRFENLGADARQSTTVYAERLRAMSCDIHCTCITMSAMNRSSGYNTGNTTIAAAKESGDIDFTADIIMAIGPVEDATEPAPGVRRWMLRLDKNRQGETTYDLHHVYLDWCPSQQRFSDAEEETVFASSNGRGRRRS